jgi:hypothetical protein
VLARAMGHLKLNREQLHVLGDDGRDPFCPLTSAETSHRMRSMRRRLDLFLKTMGEAFSRAPTLGTAPTLVVVARAPPIGDGSTWEAPTQQLNGGGATWQWRLGFGVSRGRRGGVYIGEKHDVIWMDSKANFISNLILSSMIISRIQKEMKISSLRSKTLLWVGVLWPYDLGVGPWVGGGGTRCGAGSNMSLAGSRGRQSDGARCDRGSLTYQSGYTGVNPVLPG